MILTTLDGGITAGMIFCFLILLVTGGASIKLIFDAIYAVNKNERKKSLSNIPLLLFFLGIAIYGFFTEFNLLTNYVFVKGTTIGYCNAGKSGRGIEFEYFYKGKRYTNCDAPYSLEQIKVPGGKFKVRVSEFDLDVGIIDFDTPLTKDSKK